MLKDNRMAQIYAAVRTSDTLGICDIGTDHAHLPIELVGSGKVPFAIATDISLPSLEKGKQNIAAHGLSDRISTYLADGSLGVPLDGIGDIIIAGMGGELIASILCSDDRLRSPALHFVLQPMTKHSVLRAALAKNGFETEREYCVSDGNRIYFIMSTYYTGVARELSPSELLLGVNTEPSAELTAYARLKLSQLERELAGVMSSARPDASERDRLLSSAEVLKAFICESGEPK